MRVPEQRYAVFAHDPHLRNLSSTWQAVFAWLAQSGYRSAQKPDFELYPSGTSPLSPDDSIEIWLGLLHSGLHEGSIEVPSTSAGDNES